MPRKDAYGGTISAQAQQDLVSEGIENFELPKSLVMKIAKSSISENVKLQKETVLSLVKGSTVFINYLAASAHDVAQSRQHKSISASDVMKALEIMQFGDMTNKLQIELAAYRDIAKNADSKGGKKTANGSTNSRKSNSAAAGHSSSVSASTKGKGKEKATPSDPLPPPFTSTPLPFGVDPGASSAGDVVHAPESISTGIVGETESMDMDVDWPEQGDEVTQNFEGDDEPDEERDALVEEEEPENEGVGLEDENDSTEDEQPQP